MPIVTCLVTALFASTLVHAGVVEAPATFATPPIIVNVSAPDVSPSLVRYMLEETDAVWRGAGVTFVWRHAAHEPVPYAVPYARVAEPGPYLRSALRVTVGGERGSSPENTLPLGWIVFDDVTTPEREVYVSYANAMKFLLQSRGVVGQIEQMPTSQRELLLGRAMGRALAHELGHYLMASKLHASRGLMKASRTAFEFFTIDRGAFAIQPADRRLVAARLHGDNVVASR